jgi:hypothetical protein
MRLRLWRRVRIAPGLRLNLSKSGASVSVGRRGAWLTTGPRGQRATVGLPGSGLFWTEFRPWSKPTLQGRSVAKIVFWGLLLVLALKLMTGARASEPPREFPVGLATSLCTPDAAAVGCDPIRIVEMAARAWSETDSNRHEECAGSESYWTLLRCLEAPRD